MARISACIIILSIFAIIPAPVQASKAIIMTDNLNVREGPGTNFAKIDQLQANEGYTIIQKQNGWVKLQLGNSTGWVTTEYITIKEKDDTTESQDEIEITDKVGNDAASIYIRFANTQIRSGPSTNDDIIDFADKGARYDVLSTNNGWLEISNGSVQGFVWNKFTSKDAGNNSNDSLQNKTIVIDAGHGGRDAGSIGASGTLEKNIAFITAETLSRELENFNAETVFTRTKDEYLSLATRASFSNIANTDAFISIHYNSAESLPDVSGISTYYYYEQNKKLATFIQEGLITETNANDRGTVFADFQVIRQNFKPAILIELGFLSNAKREQLLLSSAYQKKIVRGIISGLHSYFSDAG